jgi:hypothetical protein
MQTKAGTQKRSMLILGLVVIAALVLVWLAWTRAARPGSHRDVSRLADSIKSQRSDLPTASPQTTLGVQAMPGPKGRGR